MIKFSEVAHFYIGCKIQTKQGIGTFGVLYTPGETKPEECRPIGCYDLVKCDWNFEEVKPILKSFNDLSEEDVEPMGWAELEDIKKTFWNDIKLDEFCINEFMHLIKLQVDLFGLIESGQAIDAKTIEG